MKKYSKEEAAKMFQALRNYYHLKEVAFVFGVTPETCKEWVEKYVKEVSNDKRDKIWLKVRLNDMKNRGGNVRAFREHIENLFGSDYPACLDDVRLDLTEYKIQECKNWIEVFTNSQKNLQDLGRTDSLEYQIAKNNIEYYQKDLADLKAVLA